MIAFYILNGLAFCFVTYILAGVFTDALKNGKMIKPAAITLCSLTITFYLFQTQGQPYILAAFAGYFIHSCQNNFVRKKKPASQKSKGKNPKVVNINP